VVSRPRRVRRRAGALDDDWKRWRIAVQHRVKSLSYFGRLALLLLAVKLGPAEQPLSLRHATVTARLLCCASSDEYSVQTWRNFGCILAR